MARIPLPFRLNHVNVYLIDDGDGWAVLDTGLGNDATRAAWETLLAGPLRGRRLTRLIVTHFHPDHIGLAGWFAQRFELPLLTSQTSYLGCINISLSPGSLDTETYRDFYLQHGLDAQTTGLVVTRGHEYLKLVTGLPLTFKRLVADDMLKLGGRTFSVLTGDGHAPEQVMFYCAEEKLFLAADQVLAKISPNVSVWAVEPDGDPLGLSALAQGDQKQARRRRAGVAGSPASVLRTTSAYRRIDRASPAALRGDCGSLPQGAAIRRRPRAGGLPFAARPASNELCLQRGAGARQLYAGARRIGLGGAGKRRAAHDRRRLKIDHAASMRTVLAPS